MKPFTFVLALSTIFAVALSAQPAKKIIPAPADVAGPPADAEMTESGLVTKVLAPGSGDKRPTLDDVVAC